MNKNILATLFSAGLILASAPVLAQESDHEGHHPAGSADSANTPKEEPAAASDKGQMQGGMGMMGNCKMMEQMHGGKMGDMKPKGDTGPSSQAYNSIMMKMHEDMNITYTGNADVDFVKGMIPHHKAAVDRAKTALAFGKDPEVKKVAEEVIKAQEAEIAQMQAWLEKNGANDKN
jgi:hypothetical protein